MREPPILSVAERAFLGQARRGVLATSGPDGVPRLVPVCFALGSDDRAGRPRIWTPIDEKPKSEPDPHRLARVRDIVARPDVSLLVDRWSEDWTELAWLRIHGRAILLEPGSAEHADAVRALRGRYAQYAEQRLGERPVIRLTVSRARSWGALG